MRYYFYILIILVLLGQADSLFAVPACPDPFTGKQPDGKEFKMRLKGDEWTNWTETEDGYPIIINKNTRFWEYGKLESSKGLSPTGQVVGKNAPVGINKISAKDFKAVIPGKSFRAPGVSSPPSASPQSAPLNITGTRKLLVILVGFADRSLTTTETSWVDRIFGTTNSAKQYYSEVSYNQFTLAPAEENSGIANDGVVSITLTSNHPDNGSNPGIPNQQLTKDAIIAANPYVDFASFDSNSDGEITTNELNVMIIAAGYEASYSSSSTPSVWAHKWAIDNITAPVVDGKTVGASPGGYTQFGELHGTHQATIGVIIHEFAHDCGNTTTYLGLPDLYDTDGSSYGVGYWDSMATGAWLYTTGYSGDTPAHFSAWCKWYLGWVTPTQITVPTNGVSFPQVETAAGTDRGIKQVLSNPNGPEIGGTGEYFLIENRQKTGYDAALPSAGILIWHIDETQIDNDTEARKLVDLEEADGLNQLDNKSNSGNAGDPYPGTSASTTFNYTSTPNSRLYSGGDSTVSVINISNSTATMTADINDQPPVLSTPGNQIVNENQSLTFTLSATDPDNDIISYSMASTPTGATMNSTTGVFSWTPNYNQSGIYAVIFTATANSLSDSEPINITVNNVDRPLALTSPGNKSVDENQLLTFTLSATDPDGDTISYSMAGTPTGATMNSTTGVFSWTPTYYQSGVYAVTFTATANTSLDSKPIDITVNNVNGPPTLTSPGNKSVNENQLLTFTLSATDPDGDSVTYSMIPAPSGATLNSATGAFNWTPDYTQASIYNVNFTATTNGVSNSKPIVITVNNVDRPLTLTSPGNKSIDENQVLTFTLSATDPDGDTISYSMAGTPTGATLNSTTGVFSWTPTCYQSGVYAVTFTATANSLSDSKPINITVNNFDRPPALTSPDNKSINENQLLTFTLSATDPDGDTISYSMAGTPTSATLNSSTGNFNWTPDYTQIGIYSVTFTATANVLSDSKTITVTVLLIPPTDLTATAVSSYAIRLDWTDTSLNEDGFKIERSPDDITFTQISMVGSNITSTLDTNLSAETDYYYRVKAYNNDSAVDSNYSNVVSATTFALIESGSSGKGKHKSFSKCGCFGIEPLLLLFLVSLLGIRKSSRKT